MGRFRFRLRPSKISRVSLVPLPGDPISFFSPSLPRFSPKIVENFWVQAGKEGISASPVAITLSLAHRDRRLYLDRRRRLALFHRADKDRQTDDYFSEELSLHCGS